MKQFPARLVGGWPTNKKMIVMSVVCALAVGLSFTPFYALSYILLIILGARTVRFSKYFSTTFSAGALSFLLLTATIMAIGMLAFLLKIPLYPPICVVTFGFMLRGVTYCQRESVTTKPTTIDSGDWASLCIALIAPAIIVFSFLAPHPSQAGVYQFLSTGWDNGSHINILQGTSDARGYFYAKTAAKPQIPHARSNSYPQGWHLATSHIADGFGVKPFDGARPLALMDYYLLIYLFWYVVAAYCFTRVAWVLLDELLKSRPSGEREGGRTLKFLVFAITTLLIQVVPFYGALVHGFANYIGMFAYLTVLVGLITDQTETRREPLLRYSAALLMAIAITMTWLLPLPAVMFMIFFGFVVPKINKLHPKYMSWDKFSIAAYILTLLSILLVATQVLVYELSSNSRGGQIDLGSINGTFPISTSLVIIMIAASMAFWLRHKPLGDKVVATLFPLLFLTLGVYIFQMVTSGTTSYYFGKTLGLTLVVGGVFFAPTAATLLLRTRHDYELSPISILLLAGSLFALLFIGCEQSPQADAALLQRESKVTLQTAQATIEYLKNSNPSKTKTELVVMRHIKRDEDSNGYMYNLLSDTRLTCANYVTGSPILRIQLHNLVNCSRTLSNHKLVVITSNVTDRRVKDLNLKNVSTVKVP